MKRSRAPNFTTAEIMHLLELVEKYPIIENKKTDGATTKEKHMAWQNLAAEYNSQTKYSPRTSDHLLNCYKNQKIKVKKVHSSEKMTITGKKKHVSLSFQELAEDKKDLVKAQKTLADYQIQHQLLQIEVTKEQLQFEKKKHQMELEFLEQRYKLELDNIRNKKL